MIKRTFSFSLLIFSFLEIYAQKNKVIIDAAINNLAADSTVYYSTVAGRDQKDSVKTKKGGFYIEIPIKEGEGDIYMIQVGINNPDHPGISLYLQEGTLKITADGLQFKNIKFSGSPFAVEYNDYLHYDDQNPELKYKDKIYKKAEELFNKNDTAALVVLQPQLDKIDSLHNVMSKRWIRLHPSSPISSSVLQDLFYSNKINTSQLESILTQLSPEARNNKVAKGLAHTIDVDRDSTLGKTAKNFTQNDTLGRPVSLTDFRGKYVLLDFWASWCQPCRMENPNIVATFKKFKSKNFTVLSVALEKKGQKEKWMKAIHDDGLTWTHVSDLKYWSNAVAKLYDVQGVPYNFLIDPQGKIIAKNVLGKDLYKKMLEILGN